MLLKQHMRELIQSVGMREFVPPRCTFSTGVNDAWTCEIGLYESNAASHIYPHTNERVAQIEETIISCKKPTPKELEAAKKCFTEFYGVGEYMFTYYANDVRKEDLQDFLRTKSTYLN